MDNTAPEITMEEDEITISAQDSIDEILKGITAVDDKDGDVTQYLTLETFSNFISPGVREATIAVFDSAGNVSRVTRTVNYSDYTSPRVSVKGPLRAPLSDMTALLKKIQVTDCIDGDITDNLQIVSEKSISSAVPAKYRMRLQVSNSAGDTLDMPVTVEFYSSSGTSDPAIQLTDYLIYVKKGKKVNPLSYLKQIKVYSDTYVWDQDEEEFVSGASEDEEYDEYGEETRETIGIDKIKIDNPVDTSVPGTYEIQYSLQDYDKIESSSVYLIVVVEEREDK
ncbi:MAG: hypothetical protein ACI4D3_00590 [Lachnospiraceae bacterium]